MLERPSSSLGLATAALVALAALAGCGSDPCEHDEVVAELAGASSGDTVRVGECAVAGPFVVPPGVTLAGQGRGQTRITGESPIVLSEGSGLSDLTVASAGRVAVRMGDRASIEAVTVDVQLGAGVIAEATSTVSLRDVEIVGPITADNAMSIPPSPSAESTATHGLILTSTGSAAEPATLEDVTVRGFAQIGALLSGSTVRWTRGGVRESLGVGAFGHGGSLDLEEVELTGMLRGVQFYSYAGVFDAGIRLTTRDVVVSNNEAYGLVHDDAPSTHVDIEASDNGEPGVWVQNTTGFELSGAGSLLSGNLLAGIVVIDSADVSIRDARIETSRLATRIVGEVDVEVGDGIHAVLASTETLRLDALTLASNERAGVLLDVASGAVSESTVGALTVDGAGYGCVAQSTAGPIPSGAWDARVERRGATAAMDASFDRRLEVLGAVMPMFLPRP